MTVAPAPRALHGARMRCLIAVVVSLFALAPRAAVATDVWTEPAPGLRYLHRSTDEPKEIHALLVDLTQPGLRLRATRASEKGQTVSAFAAAVGAVAAVNADFFDGTQTPIGLAVGEGERWQDDRNDWFALACSADNACTLETTAGLVGDGVHTAVSGKNVLVRPGFVLSAADDSACGEFCTIAHPRTAVGLTEDGATLILVVVEGRQDPVFGMRLSQLARLMVELGATEAVNLDGGGSSAMVIEGSRVTGRPANEPAERRVANHLAIMLDDTGPATGHLKGFVRQGRIDAADQPVAGATVALTTGETTTTDERGFYEFPRAPAGPTTITATKDGFAAASLERDVAPNTTTWGSIALQPAPPPPDDDPDTVPPDDDTSPPDDGVDAPAPLALPTSTAGGCASTTD
ncbi:MAG: hypothetical protein FJ137_22205, partial [Deltaproteobacteria bacterium]|nr:hypothetical protein [Deltaproteobacteria bacterium]